MEADVFAALKSLIPHAHQPHHDFMASTFEVRNPDEVFFNQNQIWAFQGLAFALGYKKLSTLPGEDGMVLKLQRL